MSAIDSPRENCISSARRTIGVAPSSATPTSKEIRVRVEGRWKIRAMLRPASESAPSRSPRPAFSAAARSSSLFSSKAPNSSPVRKSRFKQRILRAVDFTALAWNLFHGRDFPPDPKLRTWRSRLLRFDERNATHIQVNRDLTTEFATLLAGTPWEVALLQECPPRFAVPLARACGAEAHRVLTSRNWLGSVRGLLARQNPDLMASGEGGSNLTLVRVPGRLGGIVERRELAIHEGAPERRALALTRTAAGLCIANLHATNDRPDLAAEDVLLAARAADGFAGESPLIFGGDLNLRPAEDPGVFERLRENFGLAAPTAPRAIDHMLVRGLEVLEPPDRLATGAARAAARGKGAAPLRSRTFAGTIRAGGATRAAELR